MRGPSSTPVCGRQEGERGLQEQVRACPLSKETSLLLSLSETVSFQVGPVVTRATENPGLCALLSVESLGRSGLQSFPVSGQDAGSASVWGWSSPPPNLGLISFLSC